MKFFSIIYIQRPNTCLNEKTITLILVRSLCVCVSLPLFTSPQAAKRGILTPGRGRGAHARGRGSGRGRGRGIGGRPRGVPTHSVVDHRPRALEISGFTEADRVDLLPHFAVSQRHTHTHSQHHYIFLSPPREILPVRYNMAGDTCRRITFHIPLCCSVCAVYTIWAIRIFC